MREEGKEAPTHPSISLYIMESTKNMGSTERRKIIMAGMVCPSTSHSSRTAGSAVQHGLMNGSAPVMAARTGEGGREGGRERKHKQ